MKKIIFFLLINLFAATIFAADSDLDSTFNTAVKLFSSEATLYKVKLGANNKIYFSGSMTQVNGVSNMKGIVRLNADGSVDTSFNAQIDGLNDIRDFAVYPDNKVVVAAQSGGAPKIVRLNADGALDASFTGQTFDTLPEYIRSVALQTDGKVLVGGYFTTLGGAARASLARLNADGSVDAGFNGNLGGDGIFYVLTIVPQTDGKILIGGTFKTVSGAVHFEIARLNANGGSDTVFNQGVGTQRADSPNLNNGVNDIKLLDSGKIYYICGALSYNGAPVGEVVRLNADGTRDTAFSLTPINKVGRNGLAIQPDGKILAVGIGRNYTSGFPVIRNGITKIDTDGTIDASFSPIGIPNGTQVNGAAIQADGGILLVGNFASFNNVQKFSIARLLNTVTAPPVINPALRIADFDGDGKTDASVFRSGTWFINPSGSPALAPAGAYSVRFGQTGDALAPGDYDGDGRSDIAVWRESEQNFYILNSSNNSVRIENFGLQGDVLTAGDWDGDGRADLSVYREGAQSYFFYRGSLNNPSGNITYLPWGTPGDKAVRGDFDGDRKMDAAVYRASNQTWYIRNSSNGQITYAAFGLATDKRVSGDFDGDGKTDICVFRDGVWYILQSSTGQVRYQNWGLNTDAIAAGDWDGDGKTDVAVWRSGVYYILNSASSAVSYQYFGSNGDAPVAAAFVQ
ncbi:MAG TPA: FG-GAP-like repeat-containing protein [Pyrinomonadaceae bacterium]|jgi:uncharacterized delta-60 repeat protein